MNSKMLWVIALAASIAYGLVVGLMDVNAAEVIAGACVVALLWIVAAAVRRGEVGPRDRSARSESRAGRQ